MALPHTPSFRLDGKRALVTGASRGIGLGGAVALAEAGAHVVMVSRSKDDIEAAAQSLRNEEFAATGVSLDVTKDDTEVSTDNFDSIMDLNVKSAFFVAQQIATHMIDQGRGGSIIHTSSQMGHVGGIDRSVYCSSKWAIEGLTKASAIELAKHDIRVNTIAPTFIRTPMTQSTFDDPERVKWLEEKIKLGRIGEVEDIMGAVLFLACDASALITGTSIVIDGGWTAG